MSGSAPFTEEQNQLVQSHSLLVLFGLPQVIEALGVERLVQATQDLKAQLVPEHPETMNERRGAVFWDRWLGLTQDQRRFVLEIEALRADPDLLAAEIKDQREES
jgi:hypothetical protein